MLCIANRVVASRIWLSPYSQVSTKADEVGGIVFITPHPPPFGGPPSPRGEGVAALAVTDEVVAERKQSPSHGYCRASSLAAKRPPFVGYADISPA